jgi:hypothetical protein
MLFESKTLAGGEQEIEVPEEHLDTDNGFEYKRICWLFKVCFPTCLHVLASL